MQDRRDTMAARDGAGLAAPQIAETVLVNPEVTPLDSELEAGDQGCLSVLRLRGAVPRWFGRWKGSMPEWCSTNAITWRDSCSPITWAEPQRQACHPFNPSIPSGRSSQRSAAAVQQEPLTPRHSREVTAQGTGNYHDLLSLKP